MGFLCFHPYFSSNALTPLCFRPHLYQVSSQWPWEECCIAGDFLLYGGLVAECCPSLLQLFCSRVTSYILEQYDVIITVIGAICSGYIFPFAAIEQSENPLLCLSSRWCDRSFQRQREIILRSRGCAIFCHEHKRQPICSSCH